MGIESPRVRWGCHPELLSFAAEPLEPTAATGSTFLFPGGFMSKRKPLEETIEAFRATRGRAAAAGRQGPGRPAGQEGRADGSGADPASAARDRRIELVTEDLPTEDYLRMLAGADVCLAPSRWEGLGLHLFEATALGVPIVTNDNPPMNEVVIDGRNGLLVPGVADGTAPRSGIPAFRPDVAALTAAIERLADADLRAELAAGARARREELSWDGPAPTSGSWWSPHEGAHPAARAGPRGSPGGGVRVLLPGREPRGDHAAAAAVPDHHARSDRDGRRHADPLPAAAPRDPGLLADADRGVGSAARLRRPPAPRPLRALASHPHVRGDRRGAHPDGRPRPLRPPPRAARHARRAPPGRARPRPDLRLPPRLDPRLLLEG